jgi:cell division protein FtsB
LVLGAVMVLLALILASPLQRFLQQRHSMSQSEQLHSSESKRVAQLQKQMQLWNTPSYIEAQARARLQYARPGDTVYVVVDPGHTRGDASADQNVPVTAPDGQVGWQAKVLTSLRIADASP